LTREHLLYSPFIIPSGEPLLTDKSCLVLRDLQLALKSGYQPAKGAYRLDEVQASATLAHSRIWFTDVIDSSFRIRN